MMKAAPKSDVKPHFCHFPSQLTNISMVSSALNIHSALELHPGFIHTGFGLEGGMLMQMPSVSIL